MKQQTQQNKLPAGWQEVELKKIIELKYGDSLPSEKRIDGGFGVYGSNGVVGHHNKGITKGQTIIVGRKGSIGKINFSKNSCFPIDTTYYIDETKIPCDLVWLTYVLKNIGLENLNKAAAVPGLNRNDVYSIKIPLPPIQVQKNIVSILEKAEKLKQKREEADRLIDKYLKSVFYALFLKKSELRNLKDIAEICMGQSPPGNTYNEYEKGTPFFQGKAEFTEKYPLVKKWTTMPSKIAHPDSILISVRAPVGSVNLCNICCCIGRGLASITPKKEVTLEYLYSWFKLNEESISDIGTGSTFKAISSSQLANLQIPLPPIYLQQKFAKIAEKVEKLKEKQKESKEKIEGLFDVLMQKAFKGELVR